MPHSSNYYSENYNRLQTHYKKIPPHKKAPRPPKMDGGRLISRELERRRRLREEEMLRRQQAEREKALWDARQEGMEVTMSVEERKRAELLETAIAMSKEHPEDVAMLLRTWMMEE